MSNITRRRPGDAGAAALACRPTTRRTHDDPSARCALQRGLFRILIGSLPDIMERLRPEARMSRLSRVPTFYVFRKGRQSLQICRARCKSAGAEEHYED